MVRFILVLKKAFALALLSFFAAASASAATLAEPEGPVILRVSGDLAVTNVGDQAHFDLAMLRALGEVEVETSTIWTEGMQVFTGTPVARVLDVVGITGGTISAIALNDYAVEIPVEDIMEGHAILAYKRNGSAMTVRQKGPLWVVYPYDADPKFQSEVYYSRSIWQLDRLAVTP